MKCDLCGYTYDGTNQKNGCAGCMMNKTCKKIKCPNCGYETVPEIEFKFIKKILKGLKKIWKKN